jgi:hypothetical protein
MSHFPRMFCMSLPDTAAAFSISGPFQDGDFAFIESTLTYYSYSVGGPFPPGSWPNHEGGQWTPFSGGGPPPPSTTAYVIEQDFPYANPLLAVRDAVYVTGAGLVDRANASAMATAPAIGFVSAIPVPGATATVRYAGQLAGFAGLTPGATYFLTTVAGAITTTPPDLISGQIVQRVGVAATGAILVLNVTANLTML